jgi:hypothetical protein
MGSKLEPRKACTFREGFVLPEPLRDGLERPPTVLRAGTPVRLLFRAKASTKRLGVGDTVQLEVMEEIQVDGLPVIFAGQEAWATVQAGTRRRGLQWEWELFDDQAPPALFGHAGEFPVPRTAGKLRLRVEGALDITGGEVALSGTREVTGEDADLAWLSSPAVCVLPTVYVLEGAKRVVAKAAKRKPKWSFLQLLGGENAVIPEGDEITASVEADICYDTAFLTRLREIRRSQQLTAAIR